MDLFYLFILDNHLLGSSIQKFLELALQNTLQHYMKSHEITGQGRRLWLEVVSDHHDYVYKYKSSKYYIKLDSYIYIYLVYDSCVTAGQCFCQLFFTLSPNFGFVNGKNLKHWSYAGKSNKSCRETYGKLFFVLYLY